MDAALTFLRATESFSVLVECTMMKWSTRGSKRTFCASLVAYLREPFLPIWMPAPSIHSSECDNLNGHKFKLRAAYWKMKTFAQNEIYFQRKLSLISRPGNNNKITFYEACFGNSEAQLLKDTEKWSTGPFQKCQGFIEFLDKRKTLEAASLSFDFTLWCIYKEGHFFPLSIPRQNCMLHFLRNLSSGIFLNCAKKKCLNVYLMEVESHLILSHTNDDTC